jgi:uncharacterized protein YndB with AHSA1/START domain
MPDLVITRQLQAPLQKVFDAWSQKDQLQQWWGPKGFEIAVKSFDFTPGGLFHYSMQAGNMALMWGRFRYVEIEAPHRIVFINSFSDETGAITRAPFEERWPLEMRNTITLSEAGGVTTLTLTGSTENATPEEAAIYEANHESMHQGFGGTFDKLEAFLSRH